MASREMTGKAFWGQVQPKADIYPPSLLAGTNMFELTNEERYGAISNERGSAAEILNTEMDGVSELRSLRATASWSEHLLLQVR